MEAAEDSMSKAASAVEHLQNDDDHDGPTDIVASFDGSWQRRGYASLNGIVSCIERTNDKIIDTVKTKKCKSCMFWEKRKDSLKYQDWKDNVCSINHNGSASSMETCGTIDIFKRYFQEISATQPSLVMVIHLPTLLWLKKTHIGGMNWTHAEASWDKSTQQA